MVENCIKRGKLRKIIKFIYFYEKFLGLCPLTLDENGTFRYSTFGIIYSVILFFVYIRAMITRTTTVLPMETILAVVIATVIISLQYSVLILAWLIFALRQEVILKIFENIEKIEQIERKLGIKTEIWNYVYVLFLLI